MPSTTDYIANAIYRIMDSPAHSSQHMQRARDIAKAILIASRKNQKAAHDYLVNLTQLAESGKYEKES